MGNEDEQRQIRKWKEARRAETRTRLPLADGEMEAMFAMLRAHLAKTACDNSRKVTDAWLAARGHNAWEVGAWLEATGGYCDCEVIFNSLYAWREATGRE